MELLQALRVQNRVIFALTLHEIRSRYSNSKLGFFWALFEPFAHVVVFIAIFSALDRAIPIGESTGLFILTGIIPWLLFIKIVNTVMRSTSNNKQLLGYPQVMSMDIIISLLIVHFFTLTLVMIIFLIIFAVLGINIQISNFLQMLKPIGLIIMLATGIGMINSVILAYYPSYSSVFRSIQRPFYFLSGIFFTMDFLPSDVLELIDFNPLLHLIEWYRSGFYPSFNSDLYDVSYSVSICLIFFFIGLFLERVFSKRIRSL